MKTALLTIAVALAASLTTHAGPISKGGFVITKPGKYFLTRDLVVQTPAGFNAPLGVAIMTNGVELDLAGFSIGPATGLPGIGVGIWLADGVRRVRVHNGRLQAISIGVASQSGGDIHECVFERLQIASCSGDFLVIYGGSNVIRGCTLTLIPPFHQGIVVKTQLGFANEVSDCTIMGNGDAAISAAQTGGLFVRRCFAEGFSVGYAVNFECKLFDNAAMNCTTKIAGNPVLIGVNN